MAPDTGSVAAAIHVAWWGGYPGDQYYFIQFFFFMSNLTKQESTSLSVTPKGIPTCAYWSEPDAKWLSDGLVLESFHPDPDGTDEVTCVSFHLSAFAAPGEETVSEEWAPLALLGDVTALQKVFSPYYVGQFSR